jgi:hypothetical protein
MSTVPQTKSVLGDTQVVTGKCRISFVNVFEAKKIKESDKEAKYSLTAIIPKTDTKTVTAVKAAIKQAAVKGAAKHFGGKVPENPNNTFKDGDTAVDDLGELYNKRYPEYIGHYFIRLSSKYRPKVLDANGQEILDATEIYSGCYAKVSMTFFAYSGDGKRGISAVLNNVKKIEDGEPLTSMLTGSEFDEE